MLKYGLLFMLLFSFISHGQEQEKAKESDQAPAQEQAVNSENSNSEAGNKQSAASIAIEPPVSVTELHKQDTMRQLSKEIVTPLLAGATDFITLIQPDQHFTDKGVAILLPDWHQSVTAPKAINYLRNKLPSDGWTTITVHPPEKPLAYPSLAEKLVQRTTEDEAALKAYIERLTPMMQSVFEKAQNYPGIFLVIAEGNNAALLLNLFEQQQLPMPNAIVMLSAHLQTEKDNQSFAQTLSESEIPILDLVLSKDNRWVHHFAPIRKQFANKEMKTYYRQRQLISTMPGYYPEQELTRAIKGWLKAIGW